ncbi:MAG: NUDIX domain-containing protein [Fibrobacter sp.]|jgi:8-oxo-dGTP diphosphatase|nr:NUDIX domain-containing protein [Fibrobacter sp.]
MTQLWDILDADGKKTGKTAPVNTKLKQGEYHQTVHVWISDQNGEILIQKRTAHDLWSIVTEATVHNESSLRAATRNIAKELGLLLDTGMFRKIAQIKSRDEIIDIWSASGPREDFFPVILCSDILDVCWASWNAIAEMAKRNEFVNYDYLHLIADYYSGMQKGVNRELYSQQDMRTE